MIPSLRFQIGNVRYRVLLSTVFAAIALCSIFRIAQAQPCVPAAPGLVSWWPGESNAVDNAGGNNGIIFGGPTFPSGEVGHTFNFSGTFPYQYVRVPYAPNQNLTNAFTLESWLFPTAYVNGASAVLCRYGNAQSHGSWSLFVESDGRGGVLVTTNFGGTTINVYSTNVCPLNVWTHLAATFDGINLVIYFNGQSQGTATVSGSISPSIVDLGIGANVGIASLQSPVQLFAGKIDEPAIYNRALSMGEVQAIYNAGASGKCPYSIAPAVYAQPTGKKTLSGDTTVFTPSVSGSPPLSFQWRLNGANISGATNQFLTLTNLQATNIGNYSLLVSNPVDSALSSNAFLDINFISILGNGFRLTNAQYTFSNQVTLQLSNSFTNGPIYYTLDGSQPTVGSPVYSSPLIITNTCSVRTLGFSPDLQYSAVSDPITVNIIIRYTLTQIVAGGGTQSPTYTSPSWSPGIILSVFGSADNGWRFLQWLGDAGGSSPSTTVAMTRNRTVVAVFGTAVFSTISSNGTLLFNPLAGLYPYGSRLTVTPIPQPGYFFNSWTSGAGGTADPLELLVTAPNTVVSASFLPLPAGRSTLSVPTTGNGIVTLSPYGGIYLTNDTVTITAIPDAGYSFVNWSGDVAGINNPLTVSMNQSKVISANFSDNTNSLVIYPVTGRGTSDGVAVDLLGQHGVRYRLDASTDLANWTNLYDLTNYVGTMHYIDLKATNLNARYYRAAILP